MADDERPAKMQKREHSPQTEEAAFAQTTQPTAANGSEDDTTTAAAQPDSAQTGAANDNDDAMSVDDNDHDNAGDNAEASTTAAASSDQPAKPGPPPGMTKSAWKKMKRQQEWEAGRDARKAQRKEKNKARKERKRQAHANGEDNNGGTVDHPHRDQREAQQKLRNQKAVQLPITFIFDCSFDELMMDKEMKSLGQQITRSYSDNRNAPYRAHLCISSFGGSLKERFDGLLNQHYKSWKGFRVFEEDLVEVAGKAKDWMKDLKEGGRLAGTLAEIAAREKKNAAEAGESAEVAPNNDKEGEIVYLSSEGTETLNELKPYSTYIIGGLVDKNRYKGICHKRATERGIKTAKLPIGEFLQMNSRSVLATNHVNEIMLQWLACGDWGEAFMKVIPKRKGGQLKSTGEEDDEENDHENVEAETGEAAAAEEAIDNTHTEAGSGTAAAETAANQASESAEAKAE